MCMPATPRTSALSWRFAAASKKWIPRQRDPTLLRHLSLLASAAQGNASSCTKHDRKSTAIRLAFQPSKFWAGKQQAHTKHLLGPLAYVLNPTVQSRQCREGLNGQRLHIFETKTLEARTLPGHFVKGNTDLPTGHRLQLGCLLTR